MGNQANVTPDSKTILIVEDDDSLRSALAQKLSLSGYVVIEANDGEQGLASAIASHPHLILLDIAMPKKNGIQMLHELRIDKWGKHATVIVLTNYDTDGERLKQLADDYPAFYLMKADNTLEEIEAKINDLLGS